VAAYRAAGGELEDGLVTWAADDDGDDDSLAVLKKQASAPPVVVASSFWGGGDGWSDCEGDTDGSDGGLTKKASAPPLRLPWVVRWEDQDAREPFSTASSAVDEQSTGTATTGESLSSVGGDVARAHAARATPLDPTARSRSRVFVSPVHAEVDEGGRGGEDADWAREAEGAWKDVNDEDDFGAPAYSGGGSRGMGGWGDFAGVWGPGHPYDGTDSPRGSPRSSCSSGSVDVVCRAADGGVAPPARALPRDTVPLPPPPPRAGPAGRGDAGIVLLPLSALGQRRPDRDDPAPASPRDHHHDDDEHQHPPGVWSLTPPWLS